MEAILFVLLTGIPWRALPRRYGEATTAHDQFQDWSEAGVFEELRRRTLLEYDANVGLRWTGQAIDGAMTKAPLGGRATGPNPTDRAKKGVKRSVLTEGAGTPIGLAVGPANRNDYQLLEDLEETLASRPDLPPPDTSQPTCLNKGYDYPVVPEILEGHEFVTHIRSRGEESQEMERNRKRRPRRWVVERVHSWMNHFPRLLVRWEKKLVNYLAPVQFACAWIAYRAAGLIPAR